MDTSHKPNWRNNALMLGALAAGMIATQLMPSYEEHMGKVTYPSAAASRSDAEENSESYSQSRFAKPALAMTQSVN